MKWLNRITQGSFVPRPRISANLDGGRQAIARRGLLWFGYPWFISHDRFFVSANAGVQHNDDPDHEYGYDFYFQIRNAGRTVKLVKVDAQKSETVKFPESYPALEPFEEPAEPLDRSLNRTYRLVHGLLSDSDQKKLADEERAWLQQYMVCVFSPRS